MKFHISYHGLHCFKHGAQKTYMKNCNLQIFLLYFQKNHLHFHSIDGLLENTVTI